MYNSNELANSFIIGKFIKIKEANTNIKTHRQQRARRENRKNEITQEYKEKILLKFKKAGI